MDDNPQVMLKELALMLGSVYVESDDETPLHFTFDRVQIPTLGAGEVVEVLVRRTHKRVQPPKPRIVVTATPELVYV